MSKALYDIYQQSVFDLVTTMVIKSSAIADAFNKTLVLNGWNVSPWDKTTWRYYMNLAGEYHEYDMALIDRDYPRDASDPLKGMMVIKVASPSGPVDAAFTRALVESDAVIANEYRYGSPFYNALVAKYPNNVDLIHGILNPVDKSFAIDAQEGEILYAGGYFKTVVRDPVDDTIERRMFVSRLLPGRKPPNYIEENEDNLLPRLEQFIQNYFIRWGNSDYPQTNDLFTASQFAILYMNLPGQILNIRLDNCMTPYVHSYHVREYLESNGKLIQYVDRIPKPQLLWLYRNLRWLEKNVGKASTFELLIEKLIKPLNMPLLAYDIKHNLANQDAVSPANDYPEVTMTRKSVSGTGLQLGDVNRTVSRVLADAAPMARDNAWNADKISEKLVETMQTRSRSSVLPTKVLESSVTDESMSIVYPVAHTLFDIWAWMASQDAYVASVYVTHPITGERSLLSPKQCLIIYSYLITRDREDPPSVIPPIFAFNVPKPTASSTVGVPLKPTLTEFRTTAGDLLPADVVTDLYGVFPELAAVGTVEAFYNQAIRVHEEIMRRYRIYTRLEDFTQRSFADVLTETLYFRAECKSVPDGTLYTTWMEENGVDVTGFTPAQREAMATDIIAAVTGLGKETENKKLREMQQAIIAAMRYLSSYAIQYLTEITGARSYPGGWGPLRLGGITEYEHVNLKSYLARISLRDRSIRTTTDLNIQLRGIQNAPEVKVTEVSSNRTRSRLRFRTVSTSNTSINLALSRITIQDVVPSDNPLSLVAPDNVLDGFKYPNET